MERIIPALIAGYNPNWKPREPIEIKPREPDRINISPQHRGGESLPEDYERFRRRNRYRRREP